MICYVYLMEDVLHGGVKIGVSDDPRRRKSEVEHFYLNKVAIRYTFEFPDRKKAFRFEKRLHRHFNQYRTDGEWFSISTQQVLDEFPDSDFVPAKVKRARVRDEPIVSVSPTVELLREAVRDAMGDVEQMVSGAIEKTYEKALELAEGMNDSDPRLLIFHAYQIAMNIKIGNVCRKRTLIITGGLADIQDIVHDLLICMSSPHTTKSANCEAERIANRILESGIKRDKTDPE